MSPIRRVGSQQPGMAETEDFIIAEIIPGGVETFRIGENRRSVGAQTHHPEGGCRGRRVVGTHPGDSARSDKGIHEGAQFPRFKRYLQTARFDIDDALVGPDNEDDPQRDTDSQDEQDTEKPFKQKFGPLQKPFHSRSPVSCLRVIYIDHGERSSQSGPKVLDRRIGSYTNGSRISNPSSLNRAVTGAPSP